MLQIVAISIKIILIFYDNHFDKFSIRAWLNY